MFTQTPIKQSVKILAFSIAATFSVASFAQMAGNDASSSAIAEATSSPTSDGSDAAFVQKAAQGGMAEVALSRLAATQSSSDAIKIFASKMVQAHTANNAKLASIAHADGIAIPADLDAEHTTLKNKLASVNGKEFDTLYVQAMRHDHQAMLNMLQSARVSDPQLKAFIAQTEPVVAHHLKLANGLKDE